MNKYVALATDYDSTLAEDGAVAKPVVAALQRLKASGRKLILVTGRVLPDLLAVFPEAVMFDRIVAENGALVYDPAASSERLVCGPPPPEFVARLHELGTPLSVGRAIVATLEPYRSTVVQTIHHLRLQLHVILNRESVMVLPAGVDKGSGLKHVLHELAIPAAGVVAIGDAENDHPMFAACGCRVAVANAVPTLKRKADLVTSAEAGAGVVELVARMIGGTLPCRS